MTDFSQKTHPHTQFYSYMHSIESFSWMELTTSTFIIYRDNFEENFSFFMCNMMINFLGFTNINHPTNQPHQQVTALWEIIIMSSKLKCHHYCWTTLNDRHWIYSTIVPHQFIQLFFCGFLAFYFFFFCVHFNLLRVYLCFAMYEFSNVLCKIYLMTNDSRNFKMLRK